MTRILLVAAVALVVGGCYMEETPQYAHQCTTAACANPGPVTVRVQTPPPAPKVVVNRRCPLGHYWHPGRAWHNGRRWIAVGGLCRPKPPVYRRRARCFFRHGRWVRVWQGWRRVPGRWICR